VVDALLALPEEHRFVRGLVAWIGFRQVALPYTRNARHAGTTKYPLWKMLGFAVDAITSFSVVPLRASIYLAVFAFTLTVPIAAYVFYSWLFLGVVRGWSSVMLLVLLFGGTQLLVLGIIGEYVGRTYMQSKGRPLFLIREIVTKTADVAADRSVPPSSRPRATSRRGEATHDRQSLSL